MVAALMAAGPWAAFLMLSAYIAWAYHSGRVLSLAEHNRILAAEQRVTSLHERRADIEAQRADVAVAALTKLTAELPEALRHLRAPVQ
jgi:hypothetical protein